MTADPREEQATVDTAVLVVGAGPAGLTLSLALTRYGVMQHLIEQHPGPAHTPRAHIISQRTVEIMRHLGIEDELHAVATQPEMMRNRIWYTTLNRPEVVRSEMWGTGPTSRAAYGAASPCPMLNCPQTVFEPVLVQALTHTGAPVNFGHQLLDCSRDSDGDGYISTVLNRDTGATYRVRSRFVIGADGARSPLAQIAGLQFEGRAGLGDAVNVWFRADLSRFLAHRPGVLAVNVHPGDQSPLGLGTLIVVSPFTEFVLARAFDSDHTPFEAFTEAEAKSAIERAVGEPVPDLEILGIAPWKINAQVATRFSSGGIFCVGDAVHRHSPNAGQGLNMSVADAFNLAWKLAYVSQGKAGTALLDTYDTERRPVDRANVVRATLSGLDAAEFRTALGLRPGMSEEQGWRELAQLHNPGPDGDARRAAVEAEIRQTDYQVNGLAAEIGYRYALGAIVDRDDRAPDRSHGSSPEPDTPANPCTEPRDERRNRAVNYHPTTRAGARVPHARLESNRRPLSSLDLIDNLQFALIVGLEDQEWRGAAAAVARELEIDIVVHQVGGDTILDPYREWAHVRDVAHDGAVLVRPDRHVAWRSRHRPPDLHQHLGRVLRAVLALDRTEPPTPPTPLDSDTPAGRDELTAREVTE